MRQSETEVHVINVGHGNSTLLVSPSGGTTLIDTGDPVINQPSSSEVTVSDSPPTVDISYSKYDHTMIEAYFDQLSDQGYDAFAGETHRLDNLVVSHPESDHNEYAPELVNRCDVGTVHTSAFLREQNDKQRQDELAVAISETETRYNELSEDDEVPMTGVDVKVIGPSEVTGWDGGDGVKASGTVERGEDPNSNSLIFAISYEQNEVLLPGDASGEAISKACDRHDVEPTVVIPAHAMGGGDNFVEEDNERELAYPDQSLECAIGSYRHGKYGRPNEELVDRFQQAGIPVLSTYQNGCVKLDIQRNEIDVFAQQATPLDAGRLKSQTEGHATPDECDALEWERLEQIRTDIQPSVDPSEGHSL